MPPKIEYIVNAASILIKAEQSSGTASFTPPTPLSSCLSLHFEWLSLLSPQGVCAMRQLARLALLRLTQSWQHFDNERILSKLAQHKRHVKMPKASRQKMRSAIATTAADTWKALDSRPTHRPTNRPTLYRTNLKDPALSTPPPARTAHLTAHSSTDKEWVSRPTVLGRLENNTEFFPTTTTIEHRQLKSVSFFVKIS